MKYLFFNFFYEFLYIKFSIMLFKFFCQPQVYLDLADRAFLASMSKTIGVADTKK